jgi:ribonuclease HII
MKTAFQVLRMAQEVSPLRAQHAHVAGVDEAGRGPLAGPVVAAAVILPRGHGIKGLADSKVLTQARRDALAPLIKQHAIAWSIEEAQAEEIDRYNILQATMRAMQRAVNNLHTLPGIVFIDGNRYPPLTMPAYAVVKGDALVDCISAASILAKTHRDALMLQHASAFPQYGFEVHKGYPTPSHLAALKAHGACELHRKSFGPVKVLTPVSGQTHHA